MALYPKNQGTAELHRCVTLSARQHDLTLSAIRAHYKLIRDVGEAVETTAADVAKEVAHVAADVSRVASDVVAIKTQLANREYNVKRLSAWLIFFAGVLSTGAAITTNVLLRPKPVIPTYAPLTPAQQAQWDIDHPKR
jgi:hypothetical protein